eukprot:NODE_379_length_9676_cov_0.362222.p1 type:complete len:695 gc:universal NODE_379_length_9676_cov_0.362222:3935-1851(-)
MIFNTKFASISLLCIGYYLFYYGLLNIKMPSSTFNNIKIPMKNHKLIIVLIDALRLDMANEIRNKVPYDPLFFPMAVHPPTTTATKLKSLLSGYLPSIIEVKDSFSQQKIEIQHIFSEYGNPINSSVVFVGDDTWDQLLNFKVSTPMDSFNVWDLDTVDNQVYSVFNKALKSQPDCLIGHLLGLDHSGHTFYPNHSTMRKKIHDYAEFISDIVRSMENGTILMVMGDHGQDVKGDHGGDSLYEVMTALIVYGHKGTSPLAKDIPSSNKLHNSIYNELQKHDIFKGIPMSRIIYQLDLVPSISLILGTAIPFSNLGTIIYELFPSEIDYNSILRSQIRYAKTELNLDIEMPLNVNQSAYDELSRSILDVANERLNTFRPVYMLMGIGFLVLAYLLNYKIPARSVIYLPYLFLFASNSYVLSEQEISLFFIQLSIIQNFELDLLSFYKYKKLSRLAKTLMCLIIMRLLNLIVICREEFGPHCYSSFYDGSTTDPPLLMKYVSIIIMPLYYYTWDSLLLGTLHWIDGMNIFEFYFKIVFANLIVILALYKSIQNKSPILFIHSMCLLSSKLTGYIGIAVGYFMQKFVNNPYFYCFFSYNLFFLLGHQATLSHIMWDKGFVLTMESNFTTPIFVILNYFASFMLFPRMVNIKFLFIISSCICTFILRQHLMAWKIFFPRWLLSMGDLVYIITCLVLNK